MGYLEGALGNFTKGVFSLWFRIPSATLAQAKSQSGDDPMVHIIPLVTFGPKLDAPNYGETNLKLGSETYEYFISVDNNGTASFDLLTSHYVLGAPLSLAPSYIGVYADNASVAVVGSFQTPSFPTFTGEVMLVSASQIGGGPGNTGGTAVGWETGQTHQRPQQAYEFSVDVNPASFGDRWHHLMVSCDLSTDVLVVGDGGSVPETIKSYNKLWVVLDTGNRTGDNAFPYFVGGTDPNAVISEDAHSIAGSGPPPFTVGTPAGIGVSPYTGVLEFIAPFSPIIRSPGDTSSEPVRCAVPSDLVHGSPLGIPASTPNSSHILSVEMAELQIYTGITYTSSDIFVAAGKPAVQADAEATLGTAADVYLGGTSDTWIAGTNAGAAGDLIPNGTITEYPDGPALV